MARAGRKRKQGHREPSGRLSRRKAHVEARTSREREMTEAEAKSVGLEARMRHTGLPLHLVDLNEAGRPNAGTVHGIMRLREEITADQWHAADWYIGTRIAYLRAIGAPGQPFAPGASSTGAEDDDWARGAIARHDEVMACLQQASIESRSPIIAAFHVILWRQEHMPHLVGDLRLGLNAIHRSFLAGQRRRAA